MKANNKGEFDGLPHPELETAPISLNLCFSKLQTMTHLCSRKSIQWVMALGLRKEKNGRIEVGSEGRGWGEGDRTPPFDVRIRVVWEDILHCICMVQTLGCDMKGLF